MKSSRMLIIIMFAILVFPVLGQEDDQDECTPEAILEYISNVEGGLNSIEIGDSTSIDHEAITSALEEIESLTRNMHDACALTQSVTDAHYEDFLLANETKEFTFEGSAGDVVTISAEKQNGDADLALELYGINGQLIFSDDDSNPQGFLNPQIDNFLLPEDGEYTVVVTRCSFCDSNSSASFVLEIIAEGTQTNTTGTLEYGSSVEGLLLSNQVVEYTFEGNADDKVTISAVRESGDADLMLELYGVNNQLLFSDDDSNPEGILNPLISNLPLSEDGEYRIVVTRCSFCDSTTSASFRLTLDSGDARNSGLNNQDA